MSAAVLPPALWTLMDPATARRPQHLKAVGAVGNRIRYADGREVLCGSSGLWNCSLGFGNPAIADAVATALRDASYLSIWGAEHQLAIDAAEQLVGLAGRDGFGRVLFSTSGGAANDMALKLCRQYQQLDGQPQRRVALGLKEGYHGLTFGAHALTGANLGQRLYGVDHREVEHIPANSVEWLMAAFDVIGSKVAAVFVEPVIGARALPLSEPFLEALLALRSQHGFLIVADEVTTGFWRVGPTCFASLAWPQPPDIIVCAKAMTNGTQAASAVITSDRVVARFAARGAPVAHAETQAGTPPSCAAILATLAEMRRLEIDRKSAALGRQLEVMLHEMVGVLPFVGSVTGRGALWALHLVDEAGGPLDQATTNAISARIQEAGAVVHAGPACLQILPALTYSTAELHELVACIRSGLLQPVRVPAGRAACRAALQGGLAPWN